MVKPEEIKLWEDLVESLEGLGANGMKNIAEVLMINGYTVWSSQITDIANAMEKIERHQKELR